MQARPNKIVAGLEPEGSNALFQMLAIASQRYGAMSTYLPSAVGMVALVSLRCGGRCEFSSLCTGGLRGCVFSRGSSAGTVKAVLAGQEQVGEDGGGGAVDSPANAASAASSEAQAAEANQKLVRLHGVPHGAAQSRRTRLCVCVGVTRRL